MTGLEVDLAVADRLTAAFAVPTGSVVAVIGPNGAGKSSLVSALAGLVPASGFARLDDVDLLGTPVRQRRVGLVFQDQRLFPHLSARENVAFGPRSRGTSRPEARALADDWLARVGLGGLERRRPGQLSGGQAQRVAIARALATDPALLLLDEPMAGLDVGVAATLRLELGRHLAAFGGTTLLVTHDALDALTLADTVLVVDDGAVVQVGAPSEVAARPRTAHVARLVGLNVLPDPARPGTLRAFSPSAVTVSGDGPTPPDTSARRRWHGTVTSAVPHGDVIRLLVTTDPDDPSAGPHGTSRDSDGRGLGPHEASRLDDEGTVDLIADLTPAAVRDLSLAPGTPVWLTVKQTAVDTYS